MVWNLTTNRWHERDRKMGSLMSLAVEKCGFASAGSNEERSRTNSGPDLRQSP